MPDKTLQELLTPEEIEEILAIKDEPQQPVPQTQEEINALFENKISKEAELAENKAQGFARLAEEQAAFDKYNQNRLVDKQYLKNLVTYYRHFEKDNPDLSRILDKLGELANFDGGKRDTAKESPIYNEIIDMLDNYESLIDQQEESIHNESKPLLQLNNRWLTEKQMAAVEKKLAGREDYTKLKNSIKALDVRQEDLDAGRLAVANCRNYLEAQRDGHLAMDIDKEMGKIEGEGRIKKGKDGETYINATNMPFSYRVDHDSAKLTWIGEKLTYEKDLKDRALFPHEPSMSDISQGFIGDCYYVSSLGNVARLYPEKIKEAIRDNGDGTVTVRLFSKIEGKFSPVFVKVDKIAPNALGMSVGAWYSPWVNCFERALAAAALEPDFNGYDWKPIPENIEEIYQQLKDDPNAESNENIQKYPWLFSSGRLVPWPSYDKIQGGNPGSTLEMLLGPEFAKVKYNLEPAYGKMRDGFINATPKNMRGVLEVSLLHSDLMTRRLGADTEIDYAADNDALAKKLYEAEGDVPGKLPEEDELFCIKFALTKLSNKFEDFEKNCNTDDPLTTLYEKYTDFDSTTKGYPSEIVFNYFDKVKDVAKQNRINELYKDYLGKFKTGAEALYYRRNLMRVKKLLNHAESKKLPVSVSTRHNSPDDIGITAPDGHAYIFLGTYEDPKTHDTYIRVKNPWAGKGKGDLEQVETPNGFTYKAVNAEDGIFDVDIRTFLHDFDRIEINGYETTYKLTEVRDFFDYISIDFKGKSPLADKEAFRHAMINGWMMKGTTYDKELYKRPSLFATTERISTDSWKALMRESFTSNYKYRFKDENLVKSAYEVGERNIDAAEKLIDAIFQKYPDGLNEAALEDVKAMIDNTAFDGIILEGDDKENKDFRKDLTEQVNSFKKSLIAGIKQLAKDNFPGPENKVPNKEAFKKHFDTMKAEFDKGLEPNQRHHFYLVGHNGLRNDNYKFLQKDERLEITNCFIGEDGARLITLTDHGNGTERTMPYEAMFGQTKAQQWVDIATVKPLEEIQLSNIDLGRMEAEQVINGQTTNIVDMETAMKYTKLAGDIYNAIVSTDSRFSSDSPEYNDLKNTASLAVSRVFASNGRDYQNLATTFEELAQKADAYIEHDKRDDISNPRRKNRLKICETIKKINEEVVKKSSDPEKSFHEKLATEMLKQHPKYKAEQAAAVKEGKNVNFEALGKKFAADPSFTRVFKDKNIVALDHATDSQLKNYLKEYAQQNKEYSRLKNTDMVAVAAGEAPKV